MHFDPSEHRTVIFLFDSTNKSINTLILGKRYTALMYNSTPKKYTGQEHFFKDFGDCLKRTRFQNWRYGKTCYIKEFEQMHKKMFTCNVSSYAIRYFIKYIASQYFEGVPKKYHNSLFYFIFSHLAVKVCLSKDGLSFIP